MTELSRHLKWRDSVYTFGARTMRFLAVAFGCASLTPAAAISDEVVVRIVNVSGSEGILRVALCLESEWETHRCSYGRTVAAHAGVVDVKIQVPAGSYGVLVHHDVNGDGKINKNVLGIPVEGVGFSRDAPIRFGFPPFSAVRLSVGGDRAVAEVSLLFEPRRSKP